MLVAVERVNKIPKLIPIHALRGYRNRQRINFRFDEAVFHQEGLQGFQHLGILAADGTVALHRHRADAVGKGWRPLIPRFRLQVLRNLLYQGAPVIRVGLDGHDSYPLQSGRTLITLKGMEVKINLNV
ncbi:hypothetical protein SDC9_183122 [bioreactor metagenome]|uniref:Uncharacterized protein n=1 Tax=bioreactor metagenome TaxID=1076179 RepID=A0A645HHN9_9ZZZZ